MKELSITPNVTDKTTMKSWRSVAMILILLADMGMLAWGAMAAIAPVQR